MFSQYYQIRNFTGGVKNKDRMGAFCGMYKANPNIQLKDSSIHLIIVAVRALRLREVQYVPWTHRVYPELELRFKPTLVMAKVCALARMSRLT